MIGHVYKRQPKPKEQYRETGNTGHTRHKTKKNTTCALQVSNLPLSTILIFDFAVVSTVWHFLFFILLITPLKTIFQLHRCDSVDICTYLQKHPDLFPYICNLIIFLN